MRPSLGPCQTCSRDLIRPVQTVKARDGLHHLRCWQDARQRRLDALDGTDGLGLTSGDLRHLVDQGLGLSDMLALVYRGRGIASTR